MKNKKKSPNMKTYLAILTFPLVFLAAGMGLTSPEIQTPGGQISAIAPQQVESTAPAALEQPAPTWRVVTAYNPVPEQTDETPCIAANGTDICAGMAAGEKYVATNELPFGKKVKINGEIYTVVDRTNSRYDYRYDIAFPADQVETAQEWGRKTLQIEFVK